MSDWLDWDQNFKTVVSKDVAGLLLGDCIAKGATRVVFKHATDAGLVVKVEEGARSFCNVAEYELWQHVKDTALAKWFAPVVHISGAGSVLVMRRAERVRKDELPDRVPAFFTDLKAENFGLLDGRMVCIDYGYHRFLERGMTKKLRKADWT